MVELDQLAQGVGLGAWTAISGFHEAATSQAKPTVSDIR